jgi:hypothetical protein
MSTVILKQARTVSFQKSFTVSVIRTSASNSEAPGFKSQPGDRISKVFPSRHDETVPRSRGSKSKVVQLHAMEALEGREGKALFILDLSTTWM